MATVSVFKRRKITIHRANGNIELIFPFVFAPKSFIKCYYFNASTLRDRVENGTAKTTECFNL